MTIKQTSFCTFILEFKNGSVLVNPMKKGETDIVVYADPKSGYLNHNDIQNSLNIKSAGEFEIKDIFIDGRKNKNEETFVYTISADDLTIGIVSFVSDLNNIPADIFESTDVLLIGAGSGPFLSPENAYTFVSRVAPSVAVYYGFKEQAVKEVADIVDSVEDVKKTIPAIQLADKTMKVDESYVDSLENTVNFYFEV